jgi:hypothetical protein
MKHDRIVIAPDVVPASFARCLSACLMVGASIWSGVLYLAV